MTRLAIPALLLALVASPVFSAPPAEPDPEQVQKRLYNQLRKAIAMGCRSGRPDPEDQKACFQEQVTAGRDLQLLLTRYGRGTEERYLALDCFERFVVPKERRVDYRMALKCAQFDIEAHQSRQ